MISDDMEDFFKLDIDFKPSVLLVGSEDSPSDFEWYSEKGIAQNTKLVLDEFCIAHSKK